MTDKAELAPLSGDKLTTEFAFSRTPPRPVASDPKTFVNPERRGPQLPPAVSLPGLDSTVLNRLFPSEYGSTDAGTHSPGPDGFELGHFVIQQRIGSGGMGAVFSARDTRLDRVVALKVLSPIQARDASAVQRFQNEARAAAQLDHDNIARVHYYGEDRGLQFIAFEFITGRNVRDLIREAGSLSPAQAVNFTLQIATALRHTSAKGVVHRDIKPSNIIVTPSGRAKLVDLGLARQILTENENELTLAGTTLGTFDYISPEQAKDPRKVDVRSDIYSLGCTLYHMLTGEPPYSEGTVLQKLLDHHGKDPPDPAKKNRRVPPALSAVVQKMMASDPKQRYASADELIWALVPIAQAMGLKGVSTESLLWTPASHSFTAFLRRNAGWISMAAALVAVVVTLDLFPGLWDKGRISLDATPAPESADASKDPARSVAGIESRPGLDSDNDLPARPTPLAGQNPGEKPVAGGGGPRAAGEIVEPGTFPESVAVTPSRLAPDADGPAVSAPGLFNDPTLPLISRPGTISENPDPAETGSEGVIAAPRPGGEGGRRTASASPVSAPRPFPTSPRTPAMIAVLRADGTEEAVAYPTLEAACAAAGDGGVIELRYHGIRPEVTEKPIRIANRKITIRAGAGFRPIVEFVIPKTAAEGLPGRLVTLNGGSVELVNLGLQVTIPEGEADRGDRCSLFTLLGSDKLLLQGVSLTISSPGRRKFSVVEVIAGSGPDLNKMKMMKTGPAELRTRYEVRIADSFLRGHGDLVMLRNTDPGRIDIERSVVAIDGTLLTMLGDVEDEAPQEGAQVELKLDHVSCLLGQGLLQMNSGDLPRYLLPIRVSARNNILASRSKTPLVLMNGSTNVDDFRRKLLRWEGARNYYQGFDLFWTISPSPDASDTESMNFDAWKLAWGNEQDVAPHSGGVKWRAPWTAKDFATLTASDLRLDREIAVNPPRLGATDGTDAGADLSRFADFFSLPPMTPANSR